MCLAQAWGVCAGLGALGAGTASLWGAGFSAEHVLRASLLWTLATCPLVPMPPVAVPAPPSFLLPGLHVTMQPRFRACVGFLYPEQARLRGRPAQESRFLEGWALAAWVSGSQCPEQRLTQTCCCQCLLNQVA